MVGNVKGVSFLPKGALKELTCQYIVDKLSISMYMYFCFLPVLKFTCMRNFKVQFCPLPVTPACFSFLLIYRFANFTRT